VLKILEATDGDLRSVIELVANVSELDISPHFNEEGRVTFSSKVLADVETAFDKIRFESLKVIKNDNLIGTDFQAIKW